MDIKKLLFDGTIALGKAHMDKDKDGIGNMRGGSVGALFIKAGGAVVVGECHRKAHLRSNGISLPAEPSRRPMLSMGVRNEDDVAELLQQVLPVGVTMKREEDIPVVYTLPDGTLVTGRPDIVFMENEKPTFLLELKKTSSVYSLRNRLTEGPDTKHIIQAAHYAMALGLGAMPECHPTETSLKTAIGRPLPAAIVYTVDDDWHIPQMDKAKLAFLPDALADRDHKGSVKKVKSHYHVFNLNWVGTKGAWSLSIKDTLLGKTYTTSLTPASIVSYYKAVAAMGKDGNTSLGPRPSSATILGGEPSYRPCDYCDFKSTCDNYESDYARWKDEAVALVALKKKEYGYE